MTTDEILSTDADANLHITDPSNRVSQSRLADNGTIKVRRADGFEGGASLAAIREYMQDGLESGDNPQFSSVNIGHASDTTVTRSAAGKVAVEGKAVPLMSGAFNATFSGLSSDRTYTLPDATVALASQNYADAVALVKVVTETVAASEFTDGGGTIGTFALVGVIPAGAILLGSKVIVDAGFAGDVSCTLMIGDGSDADRYMTGTPSVFATDANGIETGVPSGAKLIQTANNPTLTITSATDISLVIADAGSLTVSLYYINTV